MTTCCSALIESTKSDNNRGEECQHVSPWSRIEVTLEKKNVYMKGSSVQAAIGEPPPHARPKSIQTDNCSATVYEGLSPVTDMANHTGI